jgi:DNA-binding beta-propeller fold protein YncE
MTSRRGFSAVLLAALGTISFAKAAAGEGAEVPPLKLEAKIPLVDIRGRIDHMAVDLARQRLFVAALGQDSLAVVDLQAQRLDRIIPDLREPQGVGFDPATDTLYVASAGDGSVRLFKGSDLSPGGGSSLEATPTTFAWSRGQGVCSSAMAMARWPSLTPPPIAKSQAHR